jgi:hypothetical protein
MQEGPGETWHEENAYFLSSNYATALTIISGFLASFPLSARVTSFVFRMAKFATGHTKKIYNWLRDTEKRDTTH